MGRCVCCITGATSEIGTSIARVFASHNCDLILHYHTKRECAEKLREELEKEFSVSVFLVQANLEDENHINNMVNLCFKRFKRIDYLINNAAVCIDSLYEDKNKANFLKTLDVNLVGTFLLSKQIADKMYDSGSGRVVILSSTNGIDQYFPMSLDYDASKAGLISLMHNLAFQYAPNVLVNAVAPGWICTNDEVEGLDQEYIKSEEDKIFLRRFGKCEEVAKVVYFLCSNDASYINNTVIRVDGGTYHG